MLWISKALLHEASVITCQADRIHDLSCPIEGRRHDSDRTLTQDTLEWTNKVKFITEQGGERIIQEEAHTS